MTGATDSGRGRAGRYRLVPRVPYLRDGGREDGPCPPVPGLTCLVSTRVVLGTRPPLVSDESFPPSFPSPTPGWVSTPESEFTLRPVSEETNSGVVGFLEWESCLRFGNCPVGRSDLRDRDGGTDPHGGGKTLRSTTGVPETCRTGAVDPLKERVENMEVTVSRGYGMTHRGKHS